MEMIDTLQTRDNWQTLEDLPSEWWHYDYGDENIRSVIDEDSEGYVEDLEAQGYSGIDENDELTALDDEDDFAFDDGYNDEDEDF